MIQKFLFADIHLSSPNYLRCTGNKRCISCCFSRVWELVASFYLLQDFLQDFLQESFQSNTRGFTGHFLRKHVLKTMWSAPDQDELLTSNCSHHSLGDGSFSTQGPELAIGIYLFSSALVHFQLSETCIMFKLLWYMTVQLPVPCQTKSAKAWDQLFHLQRTR